MVDTVQPQGLLRFRNRSASSLLMGMQLLRWNKRKTNPGHDTKQASSTVGAGCRGNLPAFRSRKKYFL